MEKNETLNLYNASTGETFATIDEFIKFYNQYYYISTSRKVEEQIDKMLKREAPYNTLEEMDFFNILAWKTGRVNQQRCEESFEKIYKDGKKHQFCFTESKETKNEEKKKWDFNKEDRIATAITRSGEIVKGDPHKLYDYLNYLTTIEYSDYSTNTDNNILVNLRERKDLKGKEITVPKGIGTVYLITFLYFISKGKQPIYDIFAMTALDAIYPDDQGKSKCLGSYIKARYLPEKDSTTYEKLLNKDSVYGKYKDKLLNRFVNDYITELKENIKPGEKYATCRDIDRALWVYGHLFRNEE